jgi:hypothetical protein
VRYVPSASIVVDFPTPGAPVIPIRALLPVAGRTLFNSSCASALMPLLTPEVQRLFGGARPDSDKDG